MQTQHIVPCIQIPFSNRRCFFFLFQIARDTTGRVFTWGFGGYGRLGHHQPKDEHIPRLVTFFKGKSECKEFVLCVLFYTLKTFDTVVSVPYSFQTLRRLFDICLRILRFKLEDTDRCDVLVIWAVWINVLIPFELCLKYFAFYFPLLWAKSRRNGERKKMLG